MAHLQHDSFVVVHIMRSRARGQRHVDDRCVVTLLGASPVKGLAMPKERRQTPDAGRPDTSTTKTQRLPPYAGRGREPGAQIAGQRISPSDDVEHRDDVSISSADIVPGAPHGNDVPEDQDRTYGEGAELYGAYPNHNEVIENSTSNYGEMESTFSKIGDVKMPDSVQKDPAPPSVGRLSVPVAMLLALIIIAVVVYLIIAVL